MYTLLIVADSVYADSFTVGARVLDGVGKSYCGKITAVKKEPYAKESSYGIAYDAHKTRFILTVLGNGSYKDGMLCIGSFSLAPGKAVYLHAPCVCEGICLAVDGTAAV